MIVSRSIALAIFFVASALVAADNTILGRRKLSKSSKQRKLTKNAKATNSPSTEDPLSTLELIVVPIHQDFYRNVVAFEKDDYYFYGRRLESKTAESNKAGSIIHHLDQGRGRLYGEEIDASKEANSNKAESGIRHLNQVRRKLRGEGLDAAIKQRRKLASGRGGLCSGSNTSKARGTKGGPSLPYRSCVEEEVGSDRVVIGNVYRKEDVYFVNDNDFPEAPEMGSFFHEQCRVIAAEKRLAQEEACGKIRSLGDESEESCLNPVCDNSGSSDEPECVWRFTAPFTYDPGFQLDDEPVAPVDYEVECVTFPAQRAILKCDTSICLNEKDCFEIEKDVVVDIPARAQSCERVSGQFVPGNPRLLLSPPLFSNVNVRTYTASMSSGLGSFLGAKGRATLHRVFDYEPQGPPIGDHQHRASHLINIELEYMPLPQHKLDRFPAPAPPPIVLPPLYLLEPTPDDAPAPIRVPPPPPLAPPPTEEPTKASTVERTEEPSGHPSAEPTEEPS